LSLGGLLKNFFAIFVLFISYLQATYVGNIASPAILEKGLFSEEDPWIKVQTGYLADFVSDKKLISESTTVDFGDKKRVNNFEIISNMGNISVTFRERLELYGNLGQSSAKILWFANSPNDIFPEGKFLNIETENHFSWIVGAKVILLQFGKTYFGTDFSYFRIPTTKRSIFYLNEEPTPFNTKPQFFSLREWHLAFGLASSMGMFTPYLGAKYLITRIRFKSDSTFTLKNRLNIGYFLGTSISVHQKFFLNAEARFYDELAYSVSGSAAF